MSLPDFTPEELAYYASLNLDDPDEAALEAFLVETQPVSGDEPFGADIPPPNTATSTVGNKETAITSSDAPQGEHLASEGVEDVTARYDAVPFDQKVSTSGSTALARERLSAGLLPALASGTTGRSTRYGITQVLEKEKLVGGVEGIADAALQTRCVELPARQLTSISPIQCFLNATHVHLQYNALTDLAGIELLSQLQVLVVHHNQLTSLAPLQQLDDLFYLDVSHNSVSSSLDTLLRDELPCRTLKSLHLSNNPCWDQCGGGSAVGNADGRHRAYVQQVCSACPLLERLDDVEVESGEEVIHQSSSSSSSSGNSEEDVSSDLEQPPAAVSGTALFRGGGSVSRVHNVVATARAARTSNVEESITSSSAELPDCVLSGVGEPWALSRSRKVKEDTFLDGEEARLVHHLIQRHAVDTVPLDSSRVTESPSTDSLLPSRSVAGSASTHSSAPATVSIAEAETAERIEGRAEVSACFGTRSNTLHIYQNLRFTQEVSQARLQRDMTAYWDDVSRVLQTAQALQQDRRRRLQQRLQGQTPEYRDSLALLQKESYVKDLDLYRGNEWSSKYSSAGTRASPSVASPRVAVSGVGSAVIGTRSDIGGTSTLPTSSASKRAPGKAEAKTQASPNSLKRVPKPPAPR